MLGPAPIVRKCRFGACKPWGLKVCTMIAKVDWVNEKSVNPSWQAEVTCISRHTRGVGQKRTLFHRGNTLSVRRFGRMSAMLVCENPCRNHWCYQPSKRIRTISSPSTCTWVPLRRIHRSVCYPGCKAIH